ncbi:MAG: phosphatase PAP2 family protein [Actinobacteria bacterium]|nr:phosphatase PAP2 family protein [Actinomycetota bacterium]
MITLMNELKSLNTRWYLDANSFAKHTPWAHGFMAFYAHFGGLALLAILLLVAWWISRSAGNPALSVARVLWAAGGTVIAWVIAHFGMKPLFGEVRPYWVLRHVEVLVAKTHGYAFPSGHATIAGAVIAGIWIARKDVLAWVTTIAGLFLCFDRVYVGAHYPFDVVGGILFGALFVWLLSGPGISLLKWFDTLLMENTPLAPLVTSHTKRQTEYGYSYSSAGSHGGASDAGSDAIKPAPEHEAPS